MAHQTYQIAAHPASDGDGVKIRRIVPGESWQIMDPFLMLDEIRSDDASDYSGGFPSHPHRGFETVTYMRQGVLEHQDHMGNKGVIGSGGAQWMTAGRGVIHSEMPLQKDGAFHGFQLWLNLPADEKMREAQYHNLESEHIPIIHHGAHRIAVLGGELSIAGGSPVQGPISGRTTEPQIWDVELGDTSDLILRTHSNHRILVYPYDGALKVNGEALKGHHLLSLDAASSLTLKTDGTAKALILAGKPLNEPVAQYGPFVMNTREQIEQAIQDYQRGQLCT